MTPNIIICNQENFSAIDISKEVVDHCKPKIAEIEIGDKYRQKGHLTLTVASGTTLQIIFMYCVLLVVCIYL